MARTRTITTVDITIKRLQGHEIPWFPGHRRASVKTSQELERALGKLLNRRPVRVRTWHIDNNA